MGAPTKKKWEREEDGELKCEPPEEREWNATKAEEGERRRSRRKSDSKEEDVRRIYHRCQTTCRRQGRRRGETHWWPSTCRREGGR